MSQQAGNRTRQVVTAYNEGMKQSYLILILYAAPAWGQVRIYDPFQPLAQIKNYLQLSDSQYQTILSNNQQFNDWSGAKQSRIFQVQNEIALETAKDTLDPMALGVRYLEVELICRDIKQKTAATQTINAGVLTDQQKSKLKTLDDAVKLAPVISDAQNARLLAGSFPIGAYAITSVYTGSFLTGIPNSLNGCNSQSPPVLLLPGSPAGN